MRSCNAHYDISHVSVCTASYLYRQVDHRPNHLDHHVATCILLECDKTAHTADISPTRGGISAVWADFSSKKLSWPRRILARVLAMCRRDLCRDLGRTRQRMTTLKALISPENFGRISSKSTLIGADLFPDLCADSSLICNWVSKLA